MERLLTRSKRTRHSSSTRAAQPAARIRLPWCECSRGVRHGRRPSKRPDAQLADYFLAAAVVKRYAWHFSADFPVLVPLSIRTLSSVTTGGTENDPGAAVYVGSGASCWGGSRHGPRMRTTPTSFCTRVTCGMTCMRPAVIYSSPWALCAVGVTAQLPQTLATRG